MNKEDLIIGIDPDSIASGVAWLYTEDKRLVLHSMHFPQLMDSLCALKKTYSHTEKKLIVIVEAGWLIKKSNWHRGYTTKTGKFKENSAEVNELIAKKTGANHETGRKIIEMCTHFGIEVREKIPLSKIWTGPDGKITHAELSYFTGIKERTNQDARDAGLIAWNYANYAIKMKVLRKK